jgi:hypothetical protein
MQLYDVIHWDGQGYARYQLGDERVDARGVDLQTAERASRESRPLANMNSFSCRIVPHDPRDTTGEDVARGSLTPGGTRGPR